MKSILDQTKKLNALLDSSLSTVFDGDRVAYTASGSVVFRAGELTASEAVINIPKDADFYGQSFNMFLQGRVVSTTSPRYDDRTWRPVPLTWVPTTNEAVIVNVAKGYDGCADFKFEIRDSLNGSFQSAPLYSSSCFSHYRSFLSDGCESSWTGSMLFPVPYFLPRGQTLTVRVTPIESGADNPELACYQTYRREYRVLALVQGYKSVHAFK